MDTNRVYTAAEIWSWKPCKGYTRTDIYRLVGDGLTALQITLRRDVPIEDRIWAVLRPSVLTDRESRHLACDFAARALRRERRRGREPDPRSWEAVRVARLYADGLATAAQLAAARVAAWDAVRGAAWGATDASAWAATDASAWAAADASAEAAALASDWYAAPDTERRWQLAHIRRALRGQLAWQTGAQQ